MAQATAPRSASQYYDPMPLPTVQDGDSSRLLSLPPELFERALSFVGDVPAGIARGVAKVEQMLPQHLYASLEQEIEALEEAIKKTAAYQDFSEFKRLEMRRHFDFAKNALQRACFDKEGKGLLCMTAHNYMLIRAEVRKEIVASLEIALSDLSSATRQELQLAIAPPKGLPSIYCPELNPVMLRALSRKPEGPTVEHATIQDMLARNEIRSALECARTISNTDSRVVALTDIVKKIDTSENVLSAREYLNLLMEVLDENIKHQRSKPAWIGTQRSIKNAFSALIKQNPSAVSVEIKAVLTLIHMHYPYKADILKNLMSVCGEACANEIRMMQTLFEQIPDQELTFCIELWIKHIPKGKNIDFLIPFLEEIPHSRRYRLQGQILDYYLASNMPQYAISMYQRIIPTQKTRVPALAQNDGEEVVPVTPSQSSLLDLPPELLPHILSAVDSLPRFIARGISAAEESLPEYYVASLIQEVDAIEKFISTTEDYRDLTPEQQESILDQFKSIRAVIYKLALEGVDGGEPAPITPHQFPQFELRVRDSLRTTLQSIFTLMSHDTRVNLSQTIAPLKGLPHCHLPNLQSAVWRALREAGALGSTNISYEMLGKTKSLLREKAFELALATARIIPHPEERCRALSDVQLAGAYSSSFQGDLSLLVELLEANWEDRQHEFGAYDGIRTLIEYDSEMASFEIKQILRIAQQTTCSDKRNKVLIGLFRYCPEACGRELDTVLSLVSNERPHYLSFIMEDLLNHLPPDHNLDAFEALIDTVWNPEEGFGNLEQWPLDTRLENRRTTVRSRCKGQQAMRIALLRYYLKSGEPEKVSHVYAKIYEAQKISGESPIDWLQPY